MTVSPSHWALKAKLPKFQMGNRKEYGQQISRTNSSLAQIPAARGKGADQPIFPGSGVSSSFAGSPKCSSREKKEGKKASDEEKLGGSPT